MNLNSLAKETVDNYYSMSEDQRNFVLNIINKSNTRWSRTELMKALIIFNKAKEISCNMKDSRLDPYVNLIDEKGNTLNALLDRYDSEFRQEVGVI